MVREERTIKTDQVRNLYGEAERGAWGLLQLLLDCLSFLILFCFVSFCSLVVRDMSAGLNKEYLYERSL